MADSSHIAIVGYGIAGIAAAIAMRQGGTHIDHFERATAPRAEGAGLLLHPATLSLLQRLGLGDAVAQAGAHIMGIRGETVRGRKIMDLRYADQSTPCFGVGIQRQALFELLRGADTGKAQLLSAHAITDLDAECGYLFDADGKRYGPYDVIVAADGANSSMRRRLPAIVRHDRAYPWAALVCLLDDADQLASDCLAQYFHGTDHVSFWSAGRLSPEAPNRTSISIKVALAQAGTAQSLGRWKAHIEKICPRLVPLVNQARDDALLLPYPYRDVALRQFVYGRVVLIGDAAHSMSPQLGQGVAMAVHDACALAGAMRCHAAPATALAAFDRQRRAQVAHYQRLSRWLTPMFQSDNRLLALLRDRFAYSIAKTPWIERRARVLLNG